MEDQHLAVALDRSERGLADDLGGLLGRDRRADAHHLAHVGVLAGERQPGVARVRTPRRRSAARRRTLVTPRPSSSPGGRRTGRRAPAPRRRGAGSSTARSWPTTSVQTEAPSRSLRHRHLHSVHGRAGRSVSVDARRRGSRRRWRPWGRPWRRRSSAAGRRRPATEAVEDPLVEVVAGPLEAVEVPVVEPVGDDVGWRLDEHDERRPHALHGPVVDAAQLVEVEPAPVALVGERRVHAAVAHDGAAGAQRRQDDLGDVLGPVGGGDQRLGPGIEVGRRRCRGGSGAAAGRSPVPPVSCVSTASSDAASNAACVLLPLPSAPRRRCTAGGGDRRASASGSLRTLHRFWPSDESLGRASSWPPSSWPPGLLGAAASAGAALGGDLLAADGEQLEGPLGRHLLDAIAAADRGVRLAVGDVHAEPSVLGDDRTTAHRVVAELAQRTLGRHVPAAALVHLGLGEQRQAPPRG